MLQDIRDNSQGTIAKIIIGLLIVSLSIWGMDAIIGGFSGEPEVATINGEDVTEREFLRVVQIEGQRRLSSMDNPDPSLLDEDQIRRDVLESLIQQKVLTQDASEQGLELSEEDIDSLITQMTQFQVDGSFSRDRFVAVVRNMGMGVAEFRETMRKQYVINQIRAGVAQSGLVAGQNVLQLLSIQNQTRDFRTLAIPATEVTEQVSVSEDEVSAYYDDNLNAFKQAERVDAEYIVLSLEALAESIEVSDDELQTYYEGRSAELAREERKASHILVEDGAEAENILETIQDRLAEGEPFAALAEEFSVDTISAEQGGDLGYADRGVYAPAFEEALFSLDKGAVSDPVSTSFGIHLIKVTDVREAPVPPLEELESQLRRELSRNKASDRFSEVRTELADEAYSADNLTEPAEILGLQVLSKKGVVRDGGEPPFDHAGLVRQLYSEDVLTGGYNTELVDVGDNMSVVARVSEYYEAKQQPLEEVSADIRAALTRQKTQEALQARASEVVADLESGESAESLGLSDWQSFSGAGRNSSDVSGSVMAEVFSLGRPEDGELYGSVVNSEGATIVALDSVKEADVSADSEDFEQLSQYLASIGAQREYQAYQQYLLNRADVQRPGE